MPGFDGTGPQGQGPGTGGRRGVCTPGIGAAPYGGHNCGGFPHWNYRTQGHPYASGFGVGRGGSPRGGGRGRAFGGSRGRRRCW